MCRHPRAGTTPRPLLIKEGIKGVVNGGYHGIRRAPGFDKAQPNGGKTFCDPRRRYDAEIPRSGGSFLVIDKKGIVYVIV